MKKIVLGLICLLCVSCATIISGTKANLYITSSVPRATLLVDGERYSNISLPCSLAVRRGSLPTTIEAYTDSSSTRVYVRKKFNPTSLWNILLVGLIGYVVDICSGAINKPANDHFELVLNEGQLLTPRW